MRLKPISNKNMSYYINMFFSTELTCFPRIVDSYLGKYYSNAVGNALTWVVIVWLIVHYGFDLYLNTLFKQMNQKQFTRTRLLNALWYCGFYGTAFLYCIGTITQNNTSISEFRKNLVLDGGPIPVHIEMGLGLIGTFFFHSLIWTLIKNGFEKSCLTYLMWTLLPLMTYYSRRTELFLSLFALISLVHFMYNVLRCLSCTMGKKNNIYLNGIFFGTMGFFIFIHVIIIPIFFIVPLVYNLRYGLNVPVILLSINLVMWWVSEAFSNPIYKYIEHWMKHANLNNPRICPNNIVDCCLFPIRDDFSFNMCLEKWEMKQRENKSIQRRKPKDRGVFVQTLKCMVAIRRKLNKRRSSDSSEDSESDDKIPAGDDGNEADSSEEESSSSEEGEEDEAGKMKREYQEETARALIEDKLSRSLPRDGDGECTTETSSEEDNQRVNAPDAELKIESNEDKKND